MFRTISNDKLGNLLNYLAREVPSFGLTKALKLLFLIDEKSFEETGIPITWQEYKAWQLGPVASEVYYEFKHNRHASEGGEVLSLKDYVRVDYRSDIDYETYLIAPVGEFDDGEFSDYEMNIIDNVIRDYGKCTANQLVIHTHSPGSKWDIVVEKNGLRPLFRMGLTKSDVTVNLMPENISDDKMIAYIMARESMEQKALMRKRAREHGIN